MDSAPSFVSFPAEMTIGTELDRKKTRGLPQASTISFRPSPTRLGLSRSVKPVSETAESAALALAENHVEKCRRFPAVIGVRMALGTLQLCGVQRLQTRRRIACFGKAHGEYLHRRACM